MSAAPHRVSAIDLAGELPAEVVAVFTEFRTAETTTVARDGTPITWPLYPYWRADRGVFQFTTPVGLPAKVNNVRRNPRVSLLFSDPTGSGLEQPPTVLVQGDGSCATELTTSLAGHEQDVREVLSRQPFARFYGIDPMSRRLFGWYYWRWFIDVVPVRISWWSDPEVRQTVEVTR